MNINDGEAIKAFYEALGALKDEETGVSIVCEGRTIVTIVRVAEDKRTIRT